MEPKKNASGESIGGLCDQADANAEQDFQKLLDLANQILWSILFREKPPITRMRDERPR